MPRKSENPSKNALYQRAMKERNDLMSRYKEAFPEKWSEMRKECFPEGSLRIHRKGYEKWEVIMKTDLNQSKFELSKEELAQIEETENTESSQDKPGEYKGIKLFNPRSLEKDPRMMSFAELTEYVIQLGIDKWTEIPQEFLSEGYLQDNRVYAFHRWNATKEFRDAKKIGKEVAEFNRAYNESRLRKIAEEAEEHAKRDCLNRLIQGPNGPEIHMSNGTVITRDTVINSPRRMSGSRYFNIGHVYAFYSEERDFLTVIKVKHIERRNDEFGDRVVLEGIDFRGSTKQFFYRTDSSLALDLS